MGVSLGLEFGLIAPEVFAKGGEVVAGRKRRLFELANALLQSGYPGCPFGQLGALEAGFVERGTPAFDVRLQGAGLGLKLGALFGLEPELLLGHGQVGCRLAAGLLGCGPNTAFGQQDGERAANKKADQSGGEQNERVSHVRWAPVCRCNQLWRGWRQYLSRPCGQPL